jgi:hypothetical protein
MADIHDCLLRPEFSAGFQILSVAKRKRQNEYGENRVSHLFIVLFIPQNAMPSYENRYIFSRFSQRQFKDQHQGRIREKD